MSVIANKLSKRCVCVCVCGRGVISRIKVFQVPCTVRKDKLIQTPKAQGCKLQSLGQQFPLVWFVDLQGSLRPYEGILKITTVCIKRMKTLFSFFALTLSVYNRTVQNLYGLWYPTDLKAAGMRIQLSSIKLDIKEMCKNVKQWYFSQFSFEKYVFHKIMLFMLTCNGIILFTKQQII